MNVEIIGIGTELLHGDITNTNAQYLSKILAGLGFDVHYHSVVGDNPKRMEEVFKLAITRADIVITTGGLGPTLDDISKEVVAKVFNLDMEFDEYSKEHIEKLFKNRNRIMTENNLRQAYFPKGSIILSNPAGTANGCVLENKDKIFIMLPGPPKEVYAITETHLVDYLKKFSDSVVECIKIKVVNIGESTAETLILDLIKTQTNPTIAPYAGGGFVTFRVTAKAATKEEALDLIKPVVNKLLIRFGDNGSILED